MFEGFYFDREMQPVRDANRRAHEMRIDQLRNIENEQVLDRGEDAPRRYDEDADYDAEVQRELDEKVRDHAGAKRTD
jgi:hypothetical protein